MKLRHIDQCIGARTPQLCCRPMARSLNCTTAFLDLRAKSNGMDAPAFNGISCAK